MSHLGPSKCAQSQTDLDMVFLLATHCGIVSCFAWSQSATLQFYIKSCIRQSCLATFKEALDPAPHVVLCHCQLMVIGSCQSAIWLQALFSMA